VQDLFSLNHVTLRYITLRHETLRYVTLRHVRYVMLRYVTLRNVTLCYVTLHCKGLHYVDYIRTCRLLGLGDAARRCGGGGALQCYEVRHDIRRLCDLLLPVSREIERADVYI
jgi:hypothetical protein